VKIGGESLWDHMWVADDAF